MHEPFKINEKGFSYNEKTSKKLRDLSNLSWFKNTIMVFDKI